MNEPISMGLVFERFVLTLASSKNYPDQRVHTSGVGQGQREGESNRSSSLNKSASAQTWASVFNF
jgi:hypothetical protein